MPIWNSGSVNSLAAFFKLSKRILRLPIQQAWNSSIQKSQAENLRKSILKELLIHSLNNSPVCRAPLSMFSKSYGHLRTHSGPILHQADASSWHSPNWRGASVEHQRRGNMALWPACQSTTITAPSIFHGLSPNRWHPHTVELHFAGRRV